LQEALSAFAELGGESGGDLTGECVNSRKSVRAHGLDLPAFNGEGELDTADAAGS
jgi:hypothetical protein